jgi:hypothetical protein
LAASSTPDDLAGPAHDEVADVPARHQQRRLEQEAVLVDADQVEVRHLAHRRLERAPVAHRGPGQVDAGDDAEPPRPVLEQQRPVPSASIRTAASCRSAVGRHVGRGGQERPAHAGGERAHRARADVLPGQRVELVRDVAEVEAGELGVVGGEVEEVLDRQPVADRLLAHDEVVPAGVVDEDPAVEGVAGSWTVTISSPARSSTKPLTTT